MPVIPAVQEGGHSWCHPDHWLPFDPVPSLGRVRVLGTVEAGFPSPAEEELLDTMSLDDYPVPNREAAYMLRVKGDSMIRAGIQPGDMVIVERTETTRDGDIVVTAIDGQWTMKYFRIRNGEVWLEAANPRYAPTGGAGHQP